MVSKMVVKTFYTAKDFCYRGLYKGIFSGEYGLKGLSLICHNTDNSLECGHC